MSEAFRDTSLAAELQTTIPLRFRSPRFRIGRDCSWETESLLFGATDQNGPVDTRRPCPCCGHLVFDVEDGWPGSYAICPVCSWQDDPVQLRRPFRPGGANQWSLAESQQNFRAYGACDQRGRRFVRPPADDEPLDPAWRPIDPDTDLSRCSSPVGATVRRRPDRSQEASGPLPTQPPHAV
ncbi:CPCC family cysteine-rich protein [Streptomyces sp. NRRL S-237]|uniref:CPCC family cysteine-rich protein n=1 Tax=Streptomyces sp. NRRL S-237 TaxID=1463895 RepID=UPI00099C412C|nr:CPCC family cysteine-rich protein [Streptomyces sp. NRRL S-237]